MAINSLSTLTEFPSLWSQNGTSIYYNSGNLGIGLSNPGSELDVVGDINFSGNLLQNGVIMTFGQFDTDGDGTSIVYNNGGEVVLDKIRSNTLGDGVFTIRDCTNSTGKWQNRIGTDDSYNLDYYNGTSWSNCVFVDTIGLNVNATSGKRLSIRNSSGISNNEDLGGVSWMQEGSTGTVVGNIFMLGDSDGGTTGRGKMFFGVRGNDSNQSAICQMSLDSFGNVNIGGNFNSSSKLYVGKTSWGINEANPLVNFAVTASGTNGSGSYTSRIMKLYSDGSFTSEVDNGDNIIGLEIEMDVTGPVNKIPLRITGDNNYNYDFTSQSNGVTPGTRLDMFVGSSDGEFSFSNSGGELLRIKGDGNVGINQNNPMAKLEVVDTNNEILLLKQTAGPASYITIGPNNNTGAKIGYDNTGSADLATIGHHTVGNVININSSGNVGIDYNNPITAKLEINGGADDSEIIRGRTDGGNGNNARFSIKAYSDGGGAGYGGGIKIQTRDTVNIFHDALTIDSSQITRTVNLAFVGSSIENYTTANDSGNVWINYEGYNGGATYFRDLQIGNGKQSAIAFFDGSSGNFGLGSSAPTYLFDMGTGNARNIRVGTRTFIGSGYAGSSTILGYNVIADESTTADNRMIITETSTGNGLPAAINMFAGNMEFHTAPSGTINDEMSCLRLRIINAGTVEIYNAADPDGTDDSLRIYAQDGDSRFTVGNNGTNHSAVMKLSNSGGTITHCLNSHGGFACHNGCVISPTVCGSTIVKTKTLCVCEGTVGSGHPRVLLNMDACKTDVGGETATCFRVSVNADGNCSIIYTGDTANNAAVLCTTAAHFRACGPIGTQSCFCGPVLCATSCSYVGQSRLGAGFSTYTNDGLFDSNAKPSSIGLSNGAETIMGYYSTGNGFYWGRMGHRSQADSGSEYGTLNKIYCQSWGARSANTFSVEIEGSDKLVVNKDSVCLCVDLISNPIGLYNVILGPNNFGNSTTGSTSNVVVADGAALGVTDTDNSVFIGKGAGGVSGINTELQTGTGNVFIGYGAGPATAASSYEVVIGGDYAVGKGTQTSFLAPNSGAYQGNNSASWSTTSDERLKKNIVDNYQGIELINQIRVRNFEYRIEDEIDDEFKQQRIQREGVQVGVIAQELQEVFPDAVTEKSSGLLSVDNDELFWYMINAIKQLNARVEQLEDQTQ
jgi:hypothetical protein